jgi:4-amino-4-deoxy-L-arabinose transferase-like glycosyltransferase
MSKIGEFIEKNPSGALAAFLVLHALLWTALPALFFRNLPLDLIEALVYGREWQLGYDKLPPLPWWLVEAVHRLFGPDLFYYLLAQLTVLAAFALVWVMARRLVGAAGAFVAVLIIDGLHYFNFTAPKFNHDVVQLPFWALAGLSFWLALRHGRIAHWMLFGAAIGGAVWAKYFVLVLAAPMALFMLIDRDARRSLLTPGPWIAIVVALAVMSPHLIWLVDNEFLPFRYADARAAPFRGVIDYLVKPPLFALSQLLFLLPSLIVAAPYLKRDAGAPAFASTADDFDRRIVTMLAFGPAATIILLSIVTGRSLIASWGYPLWLFTGLWLVLWRPPLGWAGYRRVAAIWAAVMICYAAAFVFHYGIQPNFKSRYIAVLFPGDTLGAEASRRYFALTARPLTYVIGTMWLGGNVSRYSSERPRVLIDGNPARAPWIDLGDLRSKGALVVWIDSDPRVLPPAFRAVADDAEIQTPFELPYRLGKGTVTVGWAVLRPRAAVASAGAEQ